MHLIQKVFIALSGTVMVIAAWRGASAVSAASFIVMLCSVESVGLSGVLNLAGWLYLCRIGIIGLAILFAIPALARGGARALLLGGFELQTSLDGFGVGALLLLSGWTVFIVCTLVLEYGAERTGWILGEAPPKVRRFLRLAIAGMVLFNCWTAISATFPPNREGVTKGLATGVLVALGLIAATEEGYIRLGVKRDITWADFYLFPRKKPVGLTDHRLYSDPTHEAGADSELVWLSRGYLPLGTGRRNLIDLATSPKLPGHGYAAGLLVLWAVIYGVGWYWVRYSCPLTTLFYLLIIFNVGIWLLSGLAFFFDAYRVPVLLLLAGWFAITGSSADSDHCYRIFPAIRPMSAPGPADILGKALKNHQHIVVVATAGGGIQATAWTARVLTGLEETRAKRGHPGDFASSVQLLSGVSGGSTGLMFFVQAYGPGGLAPPGQAPPSSQP
jgi:hypothetical protein